MNKKEAIALVNELVFATYEVSKKDTKTAVNRMESAANQLVIALSGEKLTKEEKQNIG